jgi:dTDP-4-amino-4,6-dideoxygalactose transaminase
MKKRVEFGELKIGDTARRHINECLDTNWITMGDKVRAFENQFKGLFDYKYCRMVSSGTSADIAALMSLYSLVGAKPGDEVIIPALSFIATANAVRAAGFVPVFVDVKKETLNIDESKIEQKIDTNKTIAIMSVNLMGRPSELDYINKLCMDYDLVHIVDNCEGYGAKFKGRYSLDYADMETTSHYTAHIAMSGEGGTVMTNSKILDSTLEAVRSHGRMGGSLYFDHRIFGLNFKNTDLHASIGLEQLEDFWNNFNIRKRNVIFMREALRGYEDLVWFSEEDEGNINAPHGFSIVFKKKENADIFRKEIENYSIHVKRNFGSMPTQHETFKYLGHKLGDFPNAEWIGDNGWHWGVHKYLSDDDLQYLVTSMKEILNKCYST